MTAPVACYGSSRLLGYDASISGLERCSTIFLIEYAGFIASELSSMLSYDINRLCDPLLFGFSSRRFGI